MTNLRGLLLSLLLLLGFMSQQAGDAHAAEIPVSRTILTIYSSMGNDQLAYGAAHQKAEMPLNHLGFLLDYHDIEKGLPSDENLKNADGILTWFPEGIQLQDPEGYMAWLTRAVDAGKRVVIIGDSGINRDRAGNEVPIEKVNAFLHKLGLETDRSWQDLTYDVSVVYSDNEIMNFERPVSGVLQSYWQMRAVSDKVKPLLVLRKNNDASSDSIIAAILPQGGYIAERYAVFDEMDEANDYSDQKIYRRQWYLNPFKFFRAAYDTDALPKPDTTTLTGRRIFYSHIDGDGWNNMSTVPAYNKTFTLAPEVIRKEIVEQFHDLPITIAPIAADLDKSWVGSDVSQQVARELFAEPNVEPASHTYSHPYLWSFFRKYDPNQEAQYLKNYAFGSWKDFSLTSLIGGKDSSSDEADVKCPYDESPYVKESINPYETPRAYANKKYSLAREVKGSVDFISQFVPKDKKIRLIQWSGNTLPYECALWEARQYGLLNINGGDSRMDNEFPSYAWVAPVGRQVGKEVQIYASNSNENTYTLNWTDRYYGFQFLINTSKNTDLPIRLKPFNIYYHMFSGEKLASLNALRRNFQYVRDNIATLHPVFTSRYAEVANGFYTTRLVQEDENSWKVLDRGHLQTIRFDHALLKTVDYSRSKGILGHSRLQGSLYVFMDPDAKEPVVALKKDNNWGKPTEANTPYLTSSNWDIWGFKSSQNASEMEFSAQGFGNGNMKWKMPGTGKYSLYSVGADGTTKALQEAATDGEGMIEFTVNMNGQVPTRLMIKRNEV